MSADVVNNVARGSAAALIALMFAVPVAAQTPDYDQTYARYLASARRTEAGRSLWFTDLATDLRARHVNDLITIRVVESLTASGSADSSIGKNGSASASFPGKIGTALSKALPASTETSFQGTGGTSRSTELSAMLTARVTEVLPNGDLVVEGIREIDINGDRNLVVMSGVVRAEDIQPGNVIFSTQIGQLRIQALSAGLMKDSLTPGWLIRILNKVF